MTTVKCPILLDKMRNLQQDVRTELCRSKLLTKHTGHVWYVRTTFHLVTEWRSIGGLSLQRQNLHKSASSFRHLVDITHYVSQFQEHLCWNENAGTCEIVVIYLHIQQLISLNRLQARNQHPIDINHPMRLPSIIWGPVVEARLRTISSWWKFETAPPSICSLNSTCSGKSKLSCMETSNDLRKRVPSTEAQKAFHGSYSAKHFGHPWRTWDTISFWKPHYGLCSFDRAAHRAYSHWSRVLGTYVA